MQAANLEAGGLTALHGLPEHRQRNAELGVLLAGGDLLVRVGANTGSDPNQHLLAAAGWEARRRLESNRH